MYEDNCLSTLNTGQQATVTKITSNDGIRRRLLDIGLIPGTVVECIGKSPMGDPSAFLIRGAVIALRREDCKDILIDAVRG